MPFCVNFANCVIYLGAEVRLRHIPPCHLTHHAHCTVERVLVRHRVLFFDYDGVIVCFAGVVLLVGRELDHIGRVNELHECWVIRLLAG